jgi:hypothetical protein
MSVCRTVPLSGTTDNLLLFSDSVLGDKNGLPAFFFSMFVSGNKSSVNEAFRDEL